MKGIVCLCLRSLLRDYEDVARYGERIARCGSGVGSNLGGEGYWEMGIGMEGDRDD